jgi:hypothetical protein
VACRRYARLFRKCAESRTEFLVGVATLAGWRAPPLAGAGRVARRRSRAQGQLARRRSPIRSGQAADARRFVVVTSV